MKPSVVFWGILAFTASVNAQYFSDGWSPGQPTAEAAPQAAPTFVPQKETTGTPSLNGLSSLFDISTLLSTKPAVALFARLGINITERLEGVMERSKIWDERIQLITDDNFHDLIVNESLTEQEEQDRTWIIIISVSAGKQDGISKIMDDIFDKAYNETQIEGDLPSVRWGRMDYFNVTYITTKWNVWQAPYLVVLRDRGQTLRFYRPQQLRLRDGAMRAFLANEDWKFTPPWTSMYAPGGSREYILDFIATWMTKIYNIVVMIPRWLLFIISGSLASIVINFLHKGPTKQAPPPKQPRAPTATATTTAVAEKATPNPASQPGKRKRTHAKK